MQPENPAELGTNPRRDGRRRRTTDMNAHDRTTFSTARAGFDADLAIRTGECIAALVNVLGTMVALCPDSDVPSRLRSRTDEIARRLRRGPAPARAKGLGDALGAAKGGHA
jgi:hypothetical protein